MGYLVPLMPLLGSLPLAVAAVLIARMWLGHRDQRGTLAERVEALEAELQSLREGQAELHERAEFAERLLHQVKDGQR